MMRAPISEAELRRFAHLAAPLLQGTAAGGFGPRAARNRPGRGLEFLDTRHYAPGDDIRTIDWRQSARNQRLIIRRYRDETAADWFICIDCSASVGWGGRKWPATVSLATALAYTLLYAGHRVAVLLFSDRINGICKLGRGAHHFAALLKTLSVGAASVGAASRRDYRGRRPLPQISLPQPLVGAASRRDYRGQRPLPQISLPQPLVGAASRRDYRGQRPLPQKSLPQSKSNLGLCRPLLSQNSNVFILSDFLEPDGMRPDLKSIRSRAATVNAIQILDDDEVRAPARAVTELRDVESGEIRHVEISDRTVQDATDKLQAHCETLSTDCSGIGVHFTTCRTEQHWQRVLLDHLRPSR